MAALASTWCSHAPGPRPASLRTRPWRRPALLRRRPPARGCQRRQRWPRRPQQAPPVHPATRPSAHPRWAPAPPRRPRSALLPPPQPGLAWSQGRGRRPAAPRRRRGAGARCARAARAPRRARARARPRARRGTVAPARPCSAPPPAAGRPPARRARAVRERAGRALPIGAHAPQRCCLFDADARKVRCAPSLERMSAGTRCTTLTVQRAQTSAPGARTSWQVEVPVAHTEKGCLLLVVILSPELPAAEAEGWQRDFLPCI